MKRLILNADDFGLTEGVNRAVREAHVNGILTSATLMAKGCAFASALQLSKASPQLSVGCHVVLVDGSPDLDPTRVPSLLPPGQSTRFRQSLAQFAALSFANQLNPSEIEAEASAQIRKLQAAGITVSHIDTHKHTHIFPNVLRPLLRAAKSCGVPAIRNPFDPVRVSLFAQQPSLWKRLTQVKLLRGLSPTFLKEVQQADMVSPDGTLSIAATGALDETLFARLLENLPDGTWEFVVHPGYNDEELRQTGTRLTQSRLRELEILTSTAARAVVNKYGFELISYRDLRP